MPNPRRLALFLDGTWNTITSNTNVWRLRALCVNAPDQLIYYNQGVGTQYGEKLKGGMFGYGLDQEVIDAYEWLMETYNPGDQLFIFGFSRGAYTARSLSGLISKCGMLEPGAPLGVGQLYDRYRSTAPRRTIRQLKAAKEKNPAAAFDLEEQWMLTYSAAIPIRFIGVWDTVGSLGVPFGSIPILSRSNYKFLETDLRINNTYAYHALALDEHREAFRPTLWTRTFHPHDPASDYPKRLLNDVEQRWFVGAHANVGGGYESDVLAQLPLKWMAGKATLHGLKFRREIAIDGDANQAQITDSYASFMYGIYRRLSRPYQRPIGVEPTKVGQGKLMETINETIDASVFERWRNVPSYRPRGLVDWLQRKSADIGALTHTVRADDVSIVIDAVPPIAANLNTASGEQPVQHEKPSTEGAA